ncbi:hypothetical protein ABB02_01122 [Clostridiaceae bacterium JG1575]|nr:hypothetical protein ABB02_01122 [Clostridiaceae bacterium JG1575]
MRGEKFVSNGIENVPGLIHHQLTVEGGPLSVYEAGDKDRPVIIMLHGALASEARFDWDQLFPFLSLSYHVFAVDTPRHGKSRPWAGEMNHTRLMDILDQGFKQLGLQKFSMVGLSMGGGLSIEYAALHPDKVHSMTLFEPGGLADKYDRQFLTWLYIKTPGMSCYITKKYAKMDDAGLRKMLHSIFVGGSKPTDPERLLSILRDEINGKYNHGETDLDDWQLALTGPFKAKWNLLDKIPQIKCPTLWLRGADSVLVKQNEMERAVSSITKATSELIVIPNSGHLLPLERPQQANMAVKSFFDKGYGI